MKKITYFSLALWFLCLAQASAQDPQFSQFYANPVYLNPSLVGITGKNRAVFIHRRQGATPYGFNTSAFSLDGTLSTQSGWGLQVIHDTQMSGLISSTAYYSSLGHRLNLSKNAQLGLGIKVGMYQKMLDWDQLVFEDQLDERNGLINNTNEQLGRNRIANADISAGAIYYSKNLFAGAVINHVNEPVENFNDENGAKLPARFTLHAGGFIYSKSYRRQEYVLSPNLIYERQGEFNYWHLGMYYGSNAWTVGAWYRWDDSIIFSLGANIADFRLGYSHDIPVVAHKAPAGNAHELTLAYLFTLTKNKVKNRYKGKCPSFQKYLF